uniref:Retrovirus-related Pol polyprotein from transposon TNT 1-94-like beta-barrel domain-containing protein n=1 Tax=Tanacetum cinerariifolium TaxID=118510 RepID=A0A6L2JI41_TANCI|nr:hypothetical protein CTI12_AA390580 [Tanacetum cinerariifolium]
MERTILDNSSDANIRGKGDVMLKYTSGKEFKLTNALYVPRIRERCSSYVYGRCFESFRNLRCHNYALNGPNDVKTKAMEESDLRW